MWNKTSIKTSLYKVIGNVHMYELLSEKINNVVFTSPSILMHGEAQKTAQANVFVSEQTQHTTLPFTYTFYYYSI